MFEGFSIKAIVNTLQGSIPFFNLKGKKGLYKRLLPNLQIGMNQIASRGIIFIFEDNVNIQTARMTETAVTDNQMSSSSSQLR